MNSKFKIALSLLVRSHTGSDDAGNVFVFSDANISDANAYEAAWKAVAAGLVEMRQQKQ